MTETLRRGYKPKSMTLTECRVEHNSTLPQRPGYERGRAPRVRRCVIEDQTGPGLFDYETRICEFDEQSGEQHFADTPTLAFRASGLSYESTGTLVETGEMDDLSVDRTTPDSIREKISAAKRVEHF